jgi:TolB protein
VTASNIEKPYPVWDASGKELLFRNNSSQAFKVALTSGKEQEILQEMDLVSSPVISPDGTELLFTRYRTELKDSGNLWLASLDGQKARILTREKGIQYDPDWSSNGNWIVYISGHGYRTGEVYILNLANKETRRLTDNNYRELLPVFSPDSKKIAYSADTTGNYEIWTMNTDGSNRMQLTNAEGIDTRPYWSPDGKKLVFVSNRSGTLQLWIMDSNGNNIRQLTSGAPSMDPCWRSNNAK